MNELRSRASDFIYLGAMKSPLGRIQNKFRYQILTRFNRNLHDDMVNFIGDVVRKQRTPKNVNVFVEINPQNLS